MTKAAADLGPARLVLNRHGQHRDWRIWLGLSLTLGWLLLGAIYISGTVGWSGFRTLPAETMGNFLEGGFAPLAFLWLVIGYFLQQKELAQNTDALRQQFREIQRSAEQAELQAQAQARSEINARQETFLTIARQVRNQLGVIAGMLYISSQAADEMGQVSNDEQSRLWGLLGNNDPEVFSRRLIELHVTTREHKPHSCYELFYGTAIRARHSNNFIQTFDRLLTRARNCDPDGLITDSLLTSGHGFLYKIASNYRKEAPPELADPKSTGVHIGI